MLDERVHTGVKKAFPGHQVSTVKEMGWRSIPDKKLLALAEGQFDIFVTVDKGFQHEQDLSRTTLGIVLVLVPNNKIESYQPLFSDLLRAVEGVHPGQLVLVVS